MEEPMVHQNITPETLENMVEARRQLEEAILKYEPVIEKLEELWETKVDICSTTSEILLDSLTFESQH